MARGAIRGRVVRGDLAALTAWAGQVDPLFAQTPEPPYVAVPFTSTRAEGDHGYSAMSSKTEHLVAQARGRDRWHDDYRVRVATVTRGYGLTARSV